MSQDLIKRMLKANPKERISWEELFTHPINNYLEKKMEEELHLTLTMEGEIADNVCKLYLNQNLVIIHPSEFKKKEDVVNYAVGVINDNKKKDFKGGMRKEVKPNEEVAVKRQNVNDDGKFDNMSEDQKILNQIQENTFFLLNERNKIIFLISVMNQLRNKRPAIKGQEQLIGKIADATKKYYEKLSKVIQERENSYKLNYWEDFVYSPSFKNVEHFLMKEETIVKHELSNIDKMAKKSEESLGELVKNYATLKCELLRKEAIDEKHRQEWIQLSHLLDVGVLEKLMTQDFDFKHYYCEYGKYEMKELSELVRKRISSL